MDFLIDTGVLLRLTIRSDPAHAEARQAIRVLKARNERLITLAQNIAEFWNVCTRLVTARGGYDLPIDETAKKLRLIERIIEIRADSTESFQEWKRLVVQYSVRGVQVYDAKLVAAMTAGNITHLLTFNVSDFKRYPGITVVSPNKVI
jgi:predicted nucleic acid-binding protein